MAIEVSFPGLRQLIGASREQYLNVVEVEGFLGAADLTSTGGFTGLLGMFKAEYAEAATAVTDGLAAATTSAEDLRKSLRDCLDSYTEREVRVTERMGRLTVTHSCSTGMPGGPGGSVLPEVNPHLVAGNNLFDLDLPGDLPPAPDVDPYPFDDLNPSAGDPLDLVDQLVNLVNNADGLGDGTEHAEQADDFIEENK